MDSRYNTLEGGMQGLIRAKDVQIGDQMRLHLDGIDASYEVVTDIRPDGLYLMFYSEAASWYRHPEELVTVQRSHSSCQMCGVDIARGANYCGPCGCITDRW